MEVAQLANLRPEVISADELVILSSPPRPRQRRRAPRKPIAVVRTAPESPIVIASVAEDDATGIRRKVTKVGDVSFAATTYNVGRRLAGQVVTVEADSELVRIFFDGELINVYRRPAPGDPHSPRRAVALAGTREVVYRNRKHAAAGS